MNKPITVQKNNIYIYICINYMHLIIITQEIECILHSYSNFISRTYNIYKHGH